MSLRISSTLENQPALPTARSRYSLQTNVDNEDKPKTKRKRISLVVWSNVESENEQDPKHPKYETTRFSASGDSSRHRDNPPTTIELCFHEHESLVHPFLFGLAEICPVTEPGIPGIPSFKRLQQVMRARDSRWAATPCRGVEVVVLKVGVWATITTTVV